MRGSLGSEISIFTDLVSWEWDFAGWVVLSL